MSFFGKYYFACRATGKSGDPDLVNMLLQAEHEGAEGWQPAVDLYETASKVVVIVELPGVDPDSLAVFVAHKTLVLRGERMGENGGEERRYRRLEIHRGAFERLLPLPCEVDAERAAARLRHGELQIELPKLKRRRVVPAQVVIRWNEDEER